MKDSEKKSSPTYRGAKKEEYHLLYGSKYEYDNKKDGILAIQDGNKKFFYISNPKEHDLYLKIVNYIGFEDDMLVIQNYRIAGVHYKKKEQGAEWTYLWKEHS